VPLYIVYQIKGQDPLATPAFFVKNNFSRFFYCNNLTNLIRFYKYLSDIKNTI